jgi:hypothetical protein
MNQTIFILNILGTLFLSIEAIKIENFQKMINFIRGSNSVLNPKIEWTDETKANSSEQSFEANFFAFILFFGVSSYLLLSYFFIKLKLYFKIPLALFGGFVLWTILITLNECFLWLLKIIIKNTTKGIIGLLGFIFLSVSFYLQYLIAISTK